MGRFLFETDKFDYKQSLPRGSDNSGRERLRRTCCAFANSDGGFLVFGISDDTKKSPKDRLVGIDSSSDFPQQFGNYPRTCHPSIEWDFLNPPLTLDCGKVLHVVEIPKSWKAPHAAGDRDAGWRFTKRTNQGDEGMAIEEIRSAFLGQYEKRLKLQLLRAELLGLKEDASNGYITNSEELQSSYSLVTYDTTVIESIVADTYSITADDAQLLKALSGIRRVARIANNKIHSFLGVVHLPLTNQGDMLKKHNEYMRSRCQRLVELCDVAMARLDDLLNR
ncbi:MAG: ATP-binding protein [Candidatus Nealsonbacteria bacterium]|nr:ATP-binding protein [Candidatus Nealsonbacteria bacterium]